MESRRGRWWRLMTCRDQLGESWWSCKGRWRWGGGRGRGGGGGQSAQKMSALRSVGRGRECGEGRTQSYEATRWMQCPWIDSRQKKRNLKIRLNYPIKTMILPQSERVKAAERRQFSPNPFEWGAVSLNSQLLWYLDAWEHLVIDLFDLAKGKGKLHFWQNFIGWW